MVVTIFIWVSFQLIVCENAFLISKIEGGIVDFLMKKLDVFLTITISSVNIILFINKTNIEGNEKSFV